MHWSGDCAGHDVAGCGAGAGGEADAFVAAVVEAAVAVAVAASANAYVGAHASSWTNSVADFDRVVGAGCAGVVADARRTRSTADVAAVGQTIDRRRRRSIECSWLRGELSLNGTSGGGDVGTRSNP